MFKRIVVAVNLRPDGDRALPVARALGTLAGIDVELVSVTRERTSTQVEDDELSWRASLFDATATTVLHTGDVAQALAGHVDARPDSLLVMATSAKPPIVGTWRGSVSEATLTLIERSVLLVGPRVPSELFWTRPTPVVCIDPGTPHTAAVRVLVEWAQTFPTEVPWIVGVVPRAASAETAVEDALCHSQMDQVATALRDVGIEARCRLVHSGETAFGLDDFADRVEQPFFVTMSTRLASGHLWRSTTRQLLRRSCRPVLVVPIRPPVAT